MEDGRWRMEDGGWRMEDGGWRMEDGGWRMEDGGKNHLDLVFGSSSSSTNDGGRATDVTLVLRTKRRW
jgi:hypothetical protein